MFCRVAGGAKAESIDTDGRCQGSIGGRNLQGISGTQFGERAGLSDAQCA